MRWTTSTDDRGRQEAGTRRRDLSDRQPRTGAAQPPSGAVFHRCALQVNPWTYAKKFRGRKAQGDARSHAEAVTRKAAEIGITVLAIADHNDTGGVPAFRESAESHGITVFPGFELETHEGIHLVLLYPPDTAGNRLQRCLGELGIRDPGPSSALSDKSFSEALAIVRQQGGIGFAAHVTSDKGLLQVLQGQARIKAWQCEDLLAIQIPGLVDVLHPSVRSIVTNQDPSYRRPHPVDNGLAVAVVNAADVVDPGDLEARSATCWIKMSRIGIEGLRQAFLDPGSRIRLNPKGGELEREEHTELLAIGWESGFLDGAKVRLNPNLNVLVGGRGAGKSTIVESLRYVMDLAPVGVEASKVHEGIVRNVLRGGTKISLDVRSHHPAPREYRIERIVPNPPIVRDAQGQVTDLLPEDVVPRVEVYGQHEISELTGNPGKLTRLLDRFVKRDPSLARRKAELRRELRTTRRFLAETDQELERIGDQLAALPGLEETLVRYREAGVEERLSERSLLVREERLLDSIPERLASLRRCLEDLRQEVPIDRAFLSPRALADLPGRAIIALANDVLERLSREAETMVDGFDQSLARADEGIAAIRSRWGRRERQVLDDYERILRELQGLPVHGDEFVQLRTDIERLRPLGERRALLTRLRQQQLKERRAQLAEWEDLKGQDFRLLDRAARTVGEKLGDRVQVEVTNAANRQPLVQLLRKRIGGRLSEATTVLSDAKDFSLPEFVERCRAGADVLQERYRIPPTQANRLAEASEDTLALIEELELPPTTAIRLNTAAAGEPPHWQALEELSTGQKATAVLLLLLIDSDAPLIIDQPEDDLDNRFITEGVVPRMRDAKQRRQFVFPTHNANIPVLGDAELIIGLTPTGDAAGVRAQIAPGHLGSIDDPSVRVLVEELLEGGRDAFEKRRRKYGY